MWVLISSVMKDLFNKYFAISSFKFKFIRTCKWLIMTEKRKKILILSEKKTTKTDAFSIYL